MSGPDDPKPPDPLALAFYEAIAALTPAQWQDLYRYARWLLRGVSVIDIHEPMDLIQEAIKRTLEGKRHWNPEKMDVVFYLKSTMRSITNAAFRKMRRTVQWVPITDDYGQVAPYDLALFKQEPYAAEVFAGDILDPLHAALREEGDHVAESVMQSMEKGYSPRKARQLLSMDEDTYNAARKRIKRRWKKMREGRIGHKTP